jgi:hypothetical protein
MRTLLLVLMASAVGLVAACSNIPAPQNGPRPASEEGGGGSGGGGGGGY